jgi:hypothetical protein
VELTMARLLSRSATLITGAFVVLLAVGGAVWSEKETEVTTHLTIYVDPTVAREGGMVIISALPITRAEWEKLPDTDTTAMWDQANGKRQQVAADDKHFGVVVTSKAAAVEVLYPDDGTYTFNFLKVPTDTPSPALNTERTSVGSGSMMPDPASGGHMEWPSMSTITIRSTDGSASIADDLDSRFFDLTGPENHKFYRISAYAGGRVIEITDEGLEKLLGKPAQ